MKISASELGLSSKTLHAIYADERYAEFDPDSNPISGLALFFSNPNSDIEL